MGHIALACCLTAFATLDTLAQTNVQSLAKLVRPSVVAVTAYNADGRVLIRGNGFFVSETGLVMTRRALLPAEASRTEVTMVDGTTYKITGIVDEDKEADLATVGVDLSQRKVKPLPISDALPTVDQRVIVITGGTVPEQPVECAVSGIHDSPAGKIIQLVGQIAAGSTGSPVISMRGEVVGIVGSQKESENTFSAIAAPSLFRLVHPVIQRPQILNNPEPEYTIEARRNGLEGNVMLRALVGADGVVQRVKVVRELPYGLTDQAIKAAYKMKFKPATKNGKPVQYWSTVLIEFHLRR